VADDELSFHGVRVRRYKHRLAGIGLIEGTFTFGIKPAEDGLVVKGRLAARGKSFAILRYERYDEGKVNRRVVPAQLFSSPHIHAQSSSQDLSGRVNLG
jgi:hypothetical protein